MEGLLISIITICYNDEDCIEKTMSSVLESGLTNYEYILVDGGSIDETVQKIKKFDSDKVKLLTDVKGISEAFNAGINASSGEWIGTINAGDWYEQAGLLNLTSLFKRKTEVDVYCGGMRYWQKDTPSYYSLSKPEKLPKEMTVHHQATFVRKMTYEKFGNFDSQYKFAMDYELLLRLQIKGVKFMAFDECVANMSFGGASDNNWFKALREVQKAKKTLGIASFSYFIFQVVKMGSARLLLKLGLKRLVDWYRKNFSLIKRAVK